jgi:hypothetical protein
MRVRFLLVAATLTIAACSNTTAPKDVEVEDIIGVVSREQTPYFDGNTMRVAVTNLRVAPSSDHATTLTVSIDPTAVVRVAQHGCDVRDGQRSEIVSGVEISIRLRRDAKAIFATYDAARVTITY